MRATWRVNLLIGLVICLTISSVAPAAALEIDEAPPMTNSLDQSQLLADDDSLPPKLLVQPLQPDKVNKTVPKTKPVRKSAPQPATPPISPPTLVSAFPSPVIANDPVLVSSFMFSAGRGFDYIELYNSEETAINVSDMTLRLLYSDTATDYQCNIRLEGYLLPQNYISFAQTPIDGVYPMNGCADPTSQLFNREIQVLRAGMVVESVRILDSDFSPDMLSKAWERRGWSGTYREGVLDGDFKKSERSGVVYTSALYAPPSAPALKIVAILPNPDLCAPNDASLACSSYIKVINDSKKPVVLDQYRLRTGHRDDAASSYNTSQLSGVVPAKSFAVIGSDKYGQPLALDDGDAAMWFEDSYGVMAYDNQVAPYENANTVDHTGRVWALDSSDSAWKWGQPNPNQAERVFTEPIMNVVKPAGLESCDANQFRNPATNRCKLISSSETDLKPCDSGQFRNPATNRCKSIASSGGSLKPCDADQFRNPATNRCKQIASAGGDLKPCDPGEKRNPDTNRCRQVKGLQTTAAPFAPTPVESSPQSFTAWWAIGGVLALGLLWSGWEYRYEIQKFITHTVGRGGN